MLRIIEKIKEEGYLLADGATGTNLFDMGLESGYPPELWNLEHPDRIRSNHESFLQAGSDILLTNSFGANEFRLSLHGDEDRVCLLYTSPSPRDGLLSRMPSSA